MKTPCLSLFLTFLSFSSLAFPQSVYNGSNKHTFTTNHGKIEIGPFNTSWGHIYTDRPNIIFNKDIYTTTNAFSSYNNDLIFKTEGNERMRINDDTGNVGIGTTNPTEELDINGQVQSKGFVLVDGTFGSNSDYTSLYREDIANDNSTVKLRVGDDILGSFQIGYKYWSTGDWISRFYVNNNGNVGIGTEAPQGKLHISAGTSGDAVLRIEADTDNNNESDNPIIEFSQDGDVVGANVGFSENFGENLFGIGTKYPNTGGLRWDTFIINTINGNVGIGTNAPDSKLAVNGDIHAKEVKVDLIGWPDYVFKKDYDLPALEEVEKHIKEKGHLINMPSAKEVEENGVQLGEMNKLLLEKIEELTLYTLKQEQKIQELEQLKNKTALFQNELEQLKRQITLLNSNKQ
ncbi:hypothetical protein MTsPCn5_16400 [Croceitalea sp. MTPC5]|uniref:hypothetical protein n=1 Tax=Croceitalea sp. MTPC5 TaxID=3056565 RepID=UPI002B3F95FF|nr:hypothetical protein MTsPCn5_16400 [Croceitalea sp. MTPC5]